MINANKRQHQSRPDVKDLLNGTSAYTILIIDNDGPQEIFVPIYKCKCGVDAGVDVV
jgi:hypothetical protein